MIFHIVGLEREVYGTILKEIKKVGCDFLSNTVRAVKEQKLHKSKSYLLFKESIDRV